MREFIFGVVVTAVVAVVGMPRVEAAAARAKAALERASVARQELRPARLPYRHHPRRRTQGAP